MAVWSSAAVGSMAAAINAFGTAGALLRFFDSAGTQVAPDLVGSATFADAGATGIITTRAFASATATASYTLGTARLFSSATATIGVFTCTTGAVDFQFGGLGIGTGDSIVVNGWNITVQTA